MGKAEFQQSSAKLVSDFQSMKHSLLLSPFVITLSGGFFLLASLFLNEDAKAASKLSHTKSVASTPTTDEIVLEDAETSEGSEDSNSDGEGMKRVATEVETV